jgi:hypothetical protein
VLPDQFGELVVVVATLFMLGNSVSSPGRLPSLFSIGACFAVDRVEHEQNADGLRQSLKRRNGLRLAVRQNPEVTLVETGYGFPGRIQDQYIQVNHMRGGIDPG